jgi:arginyl-tRNA--protein-N-Asp/Glu arginylyltransferase
MARCVRSSRSKNSRHSRRIASRPPACCKCSRTRSVRGAPACFFLRAERRAPELLEPGLSLKL